MYLVLLLGSGDSMTGRTTRCASYKAMGGAAATGLQSGCRDRFDPDRDLTGGRGKTSSFFLGPRIVLPPNFAGRAIIGGVKSPIWRVPSPRSPQWRVGHAHEVPIPIKFRRADCGQKREGAKLREDATPTHSPRMGNGPDIWSGRDFDGGSDRGGAWKIPSVCEPNIIVYVELHSQRCFRPSVDRKGSALTRFVGGRRRGGGLSRDGSPRCAATSR